MVDDMVDDDHTPSIAERTTWGRALSNNIVDGFPRIAAITALGVGADCASLISMISANSIATRQFNAIFETIEDFIDHSERQNDASLIQKDAEIAKKFTQIEDQNIVIQNLAARLASTGHHVTPTSRRVSKDPQPFAGDNKDIAKRQQEYVNWCSQIRLVFLQDGDVFTTDMKKILHVAGLLTGDAQDVNRNDFASRSIRQEPKLLRNGVHSTKNCTTIRRIMNTSRGESKTMAINHGTRCPCPSGPQSPKPMFQLKCPMEIR
jgi:hypothetical protein